MFIAFTRRHYSEFRERIPAINIYYNLEDLDGSEELMWTTLEKICELNEIKLRVWWYRSSYKMDIPPLDFERNEVVYIIPNSFNMAKVIMIIFNYLKNARFTVNTVNKD